MKMAFPFLKDVPKPDAWLVFKKVKKKKTFYRKKQLSHTNNIENSK